jgi:hypothetical protein
MDWDLISSIVGYIIRGLRASDLQIEMNRVCFSGLHLWSGDKVIGVRFSGVSGNTISFVVDLELDGSHYTGMDGVARPGPLQGVHVAVLPYDKNGKRLWKSYRPGQAGINGRLTVSTSTTLTSAHSLGQLVDLLVEVWEVGHSGGFKFCKVWKYANV